MSSKGFLYRCLVWFRHSCVPTRSQRRMTWIGFSSPCPLLAPLEHLKRVSKEWMLARFLHSTARMTLLWVTCAWYWNYHQPYVGRHLVPFASVFVFCFIGSQVCPVHDPTYYDPSRRTIEFSRWCFCPFPYSMARHEDCTSRNTWAILIDCLTSLA